MSNYPFGFDNNITLPGVSGGSQEDAAITALRSAVFAIEFELGITPSGIYPDVRTRLDILESRINFSVPPGFINQGYIVSPLILWNTVTGPALTISDGYGAPTENRVSGSLYMRGDGYANNQLYVRLNGSWFPVQTEQFTAANDLQGFPLGTDGHLAQTVIGLYNHHLDISLSAIGAIQDGYHLTWDNSDGYWRAETGFLANNDLAPAPGSGTRHTGRTAQTVVGWQNNPISNGLLTPIDGYSIVWEATDGHWDQQPRPIVWHNSVAVGDGYVTRTNIRSNKILQSPSTNAASLVGMVNFGSSTNGLGGASANYATILGGDRNAASGSGFALAVAGFANNSSDGYSAIVNGNANLASAQFSTVVNGQSNTASATQAIVLDGFTNTASAQSAFVVNGSNNIAAALFSGVLNGTSNTITANSSHSFIGFGTSNQITGGASSTFSMILGGSSNQTNAANVLIGPAGTANVQSNNATVLNGTTNTIGVTSSLSTILNGSGNSVSASSGFGFIGGGNNQTVTGLYATILNGTAASPGGSTANGLHSLILNGNTNVVTGSFSTIGNGNNNTISGAISYAQILDGYQNTVSGAGSQIVDGYNNSITGQFNSILNGNNNSINGFLSTVLNGSFNTLDVNSSSVAVLGGLTNVITNSGRLAVLGNGNTITNSVTGLVLGQFNSVQSNNVKVTGDSNTIAAGGNYVRVYGTGNSLAANTTQTSVFGNNNLLLNATHDNVVLGSLNTVDGGGSTFGFNTVLGFNNQTVANNTVVEGQFGKSRVYGQHVHSVNTGFATGRTGEAQYSRVILDGYAPAGSQFFLQTHDPSVGGGANLTFVDGYSYEMQIRVLLVNVNATPALVTPTRFVFDVLAHQEASVLVLDDVNRTLITQGVTNWTVTIGTNTNQLTISADSSGSSDTRRAIATVEWRELSRIA